MKFCDVGGQAVIEGVMMKHKDQYAVAVRKPDRTIEVQKKNTNSLRDKYKLANLPIFRGIVTFAESMVMGMKTLNYSASFYEEEEEDRQSNNKTEAQKKKDEAKESFWMGMVTVFAIVLAVGIFVLVPFFVSEALRKVIPSANLRGLLEGVLRVILFVAYVKLISCMEDIKRVFMYHGAEHKTINCIENGCELTVENVRRQSKAHKRCGTSFLLIVMFVSILFFMFIVVENVWLRMLLRLLLIPVIAGISFEMIRFAGKHDNVVVNVLSKPGMWLQSLTTAEPEDEMMEVAIASVNAVFDWKEFQKGMTGQEPEKEPETEKKPETEKEPEKKTEPEAGMEILDIDAEEDDEILSALDRYFEAPKNEEKTP